MQVARPVQKPVNGFRHQPPEEEYFPGDYRRRGNLPVHAALALSGSCRQSQQTRDFYVSHKMPTETGRMRLQVAEINTSGNEGAPALSADGQYLFFTACEEMLSMTLERPKRSCDLFLTKKVGDRFGPVRNLEMPINTGA